MGYLSRIPRNHFLPAPSLMIHYVTGVLGAGKSYYGAKKIATALLSGRVAMTNMRLVEGWEKIILSHAPYYKFAKEDRRRNFEREIRERYAYVPDIEILIGGMIHGRGEGRGVRVIDEAHNEVNNREWASKNQKLQLRKMALARKRGWDDYILAQHADNTDAALRRIASVEVRLLNWRQLLQMPIFHTKLLPFNLFLAQAFPLNLPGNVRRQNKILWRELYGLGWEKAVYDTHEDFGTGMVDGEWEYESEDTVLWLPYKGGYVHEEFMSKRKAALEEAAALDAEFGEVTTSSLRAWADLRRVPGESHPPGSGESPGSSPTSDESRKPTLPERLPTSETEA